MWYLIVAEDAENSLETRRRLRPAHLQRLEALAAQGRLLVAGPLPAIDSETPGEAGFTGSAIIAAFDSLAQAEAWMSEDPFVSGGAYRHVSVRPFVRVLP
jgi:uncharacterized protein YciI